VRQTILDQVWITTSGFFTMVPFMAALMSFGVDRILFSVDYPFASNARARAFLDALPVSPADRAKARLWERRPAAGFDGLTYGWRATPQTR
jgi:predicted TIM-barrel fold metal-dependent hydrolase